MDIVSDEEKILTAVMSLHGELSTGFARVYDEITKVNDKVARFGSDLLSHQIVCSARFGSLEVNTKLVAQRLESQHDLEVKEDKAADKIIAENLRKRVNWGTVKTYLMGLVLGVVLLAALKILFLNHDQFGAFIK